MPFVGTGVIADGQVSDIVLDIKAGDVGHFLIAVTAARVSCKRTLITVENAESIAVVIFRNIVGERNVAMLSGHAVFTIDYFIPAIAFIHLVIGNRNPGARPSFRFSSPVIGKHSNARSLSISHNGVFNAAVADRLVKRESDIIDVLDVEVRCLGILCIRRELNGIPRIPDG
ncbi:MAG TPA: hypothetical protein VEC35_15080 [Noviherbaspirillum sp.]|nr:hypothetical protein [Noviherbaspirillum sp.]